MLESISHAGSSFVTLTYGSEALPPGGNLVRKDVQDWLKRLRKAAGIPLRYYYVGEYGDQTFRPHYHAAVFGIPGCLYRHCERGRASCKCFSCDLIRRTWQKGKTDCAQLEQDSAQYIAGYVVKKMTKKTDPRLGGRTPEFGQPSLKPGLGAFAVDALADVMTTEHGVNEIIRTGDVPLAIMQGTKKLPLGRYLRRKLREKLGFKETSTPQEVQISLQIEMSSLLSEELKKPENRSKSLRKILVDLNKQAVINMETRQKIFSKKGSL